MLAPAFWESFGSPAMLQALARTLAELSETPRRIAVALSGGADSAMLAVHACLYARRLGLEVHCFHVHHGLQEFADQWQAHAHDLAHLLGVACHSVGVRVEQGGGDGIESAARDARYRAFNELAALTGVSHILLAHHRNDQAETVLLRLLRGAGPTGLSAMAAATRRGALTYLRPWLDIDRADILAQAEAFSAVAGWEPVNDPTNVDDGYTRAAVRQRLTPQLNERWPGWQTTLLRHARQSAEIGEILDEVAQQDFAGLEPASDSRSFSLAAWRRLSDARQALVLRYWLARLGLRMPTDARLQDLMRQLRGLHALGHDRQMLVKHGSALIRCTRGRVHAEVPDHAQNGPGEKR